MYTTHNRDEIYFLWNLQTQAHSCIGNKKELIKFVAQRLAGETYYNHWRTRTKLSANERWDDKAFHDLFFDHNIKLDNIVTNQNLTGNDTYTRTTSERKHYLRDPDDETSGYNSITIIRHRYTQPYMFYTGNGAIFDVRNILNDVKKCLYNNEHLIQYQSGRRKWNINLRCGKHHTSRSPKRLNLREYKTKISCEEQGVKYRNKALPHCGDTWLDYSVSRHSTGWKDKKCKHQWEHNQINKKKDPIAPGRDYFKDMTLLEELDTIEQIRKEQDAQEKCDIIAVLNYLTNPKYAYAS